MRVEYLEAGAAHDAIVGGVAVLVLDPNCPVVDLVEAHDGFVVDAARCAKDGGAITGPF